MQKESYEIKCLKFITAPAKNMYQWCQLPTIPAIADKTPEQVAYENYRYKLRLGLLSCPIRCIAITTCIKLLCLASLPHLIPTRLAARTGNIASMLAFFSSIAYFSFRMNRIFNDLKCDQKTLKCPTQQNNVSDTDVLTEYENPACSKEYNDTIKAYVQHETNPDEIGRALHSILRNPGSQPWNTLKGAAIARAIKLRDLHKIKHYKQY